MVKKDTSAINAGDKAMVLEPLDKRISESVDSVKRIISKVGRPGRPAKPVLDDESDEKIKEPVSTGVFKPSVLRFFGNGRVVTPAGECPVKPYGYKENWPNGPASDDVVKKWAIDVCNHGEGKYSHEAVVYFARYFWEINGSEYKRIRSLILSALQVSADEDD